MEQIAKTNILTNSKHTVSYTELPAGCFFYSVLGELYLKTRKYHDMNCICVKTGVADYFWNDMKVIPIDSITVND